MFRIAVFVAGCIVGYVASGYIDGLLSDDEEEGQVAPSQNGAEASS